MESIDSFMHIGKLLVTLLTKMRQDLGGVKGFHCRFSSSQVSTETISQTRSTAFDESSPNLLKKSLTTSFIHDYVD